MKNRKLPTIDPELAIEFGKKGCPNISILSLVTRHNRMIRDAMPAFTEREWCVICHANDGLDIRDRDHATIAVKRNIAGAVGLAEAWGISRVELEEKLAALSYLSLYLVADVIDSFWRADEQLSYRARLTVAGAEIF